MERDISNPPEPILPPCPNRGHLKSPEPPISDEELAEIDQWLRTEPWLDPDFLSLEVSR